MSDVSNSYSAWETLPEDELPLGIAVRRPVLPPRHYDGGKPLWNYIIKIDMEVDIGVQDEVKLVISWSFRMKDKSVFDQNVIKNVHILQYRKKKAAQHYDVVVITEDKTLRKIDAGISPAFKFDTGCYFYAVDVTLKNGRRLIAATEEKCYTFFSPSFLVLYTCATLIFITLVGFVYMVRERRKEQINMKEKTITGDHTGTESLVKMPARTLKRPKTKGQPGRKN
ncbi:hypothetical protein RB195_015160 [Necator americanus]|uniref:Signal sequence receptor subunit alpha n=1 Tax=Necator americanus TaxID=51031 RepID=A0ABR1E4I7_NECAM